MSVEETAPTSGHTDQLRTAVRFPIELPIRIVTADGTLDAVTIDISSNGLLFRGLAVPAINSTIEFTIKMPAAVMGATEDVLIQCIGRVVRHQQKDEEKLAGVIIDEYFLRT